MRYLITTPTPGWTGDAGAIHFHDGQAVVDGDQHPAALEYFRGAGYGITEHPDDAPAPEMDPAAGGLVPHPELDADDDGTGHSATDLTVPLTEGAVPADTSLAITPGDDPHTTVPSGGDIDRTGVTAGPPQGEVGDQTAARPSDSANKATWVDYAVSHGMPRDQAESKTKADLIEETQK